MWEVVIALGGPKIVMGQDTSDVEIRDIAVNRTGSVVLALWLECYWWSRGAVISQNLFSKNHVAKKSEYQSHDTEYR